MAIVKQETEIERCRRLFTHIYPSIESMYHDLRTTEYIPMKLWIEYDFSAETKYFPQRLIKASYQWNLKQLGKAILENEKNPKRLVRIKTAQFVLDEEDTRKLQWLLDAGGFIYFKYDKSNVKISCKTKST